MRREFFFPERSAHCPTAGAISATSSPASAKPQPMSALAWFPKNFSLERYGVKTKVVTTALKAAEPQSHSAQGRTRRLKRTERAGVLALGAADAPACGAAGGVLALGGAAEVLCMASS